MKSSRIVKIFGFFLGLTILALIVIIFMNPEYFMADQGNIQNNSFKIKKDLPLTTQQQQGQKYFAMYCSSCHGQQGKGNGPTALNFAKLPPNFLNSQQEYKNGLTKEGILKTLQEGIPNSPMPKFDYLSIDVKNDIAEYLFILKNESDTPPSLKP